MKIKKLLADKGHARRKNSDDKWPKLSDEEKKMLKSGKKVLKRIKVAARKATEEFIKRREAAEKEAAKRLKAVRVEAVRHIAEEKAEQKATEEEAARKAAGEEAAGLAAEEEAARLAAEEEAARLAAEEEAARLAAEEKADRKAAKKQKAAEEAARWLVEAVRALGDSVELNEQDAETAVRSMCDALDWKFLKNLTGCQIAYSRDQDFSDSKKEKIRKSDDLSALPRKLEAGKEYYLRARLCASVKEKNRCSDWTEVITLH